MKFRLQSIWHLTTVAALIAEKEGHQRASLRQLLPKKASLIPQCPTLPNFSQWTPPTAHEEITASWRVKTTKCWWIAATRLKAMTRWKLKSLPRSNHSLVCNNLKARKVQRRYPRPRQRARPHRLRSCPCNPRAHPRRRLLRPRRPHQLFRALFRSEVTASCCYLTHRQRLFVRSNLIGTVRVDFCLTRVKVVFFWYLPYLENMLFAMAGNGHHRVWYLPSEKV